MPRDRTTEFNPSESPDLELGVLSEEMEQLKEFFDTVDGVNVELLQIRKLVDNIEEFHIKNLSAVSEEQSAQNSKDMQNLMNQVDAHISKTRQKLKQMDAANKKALTKEPTAQQRIRLSQYGNLTKKFMETVQDFQMLQKNYKEKYKARMTRQYKIVKPDATAEEVEKVTSGEGGPIFAQQILPSAQHLDAQRALQQVQDRHEDILLIERSILELHQLFMDMAVLVSTQGEMLDSIETYVQESVEYTEKGVGELKKAVKLQKKARKKMCCICFCLLILLAVVLVPTLLTQLKK